MVIFNHLLLFLPTASGLDAPIEQRPAHRIWLISQSRSAWKFRYLYFSTIPHSSLDVYLNIYWSIVICHLIVNNEWGGIGNYRICDVISIILWIIFPNCVLSLIFSLLDSSLFKSVSHHKSHLSIRVLCHFKFLFLLQEIKASLIIIELDSLGVTQKTVYLQARNYYIVGVAY